MKKILITGGAGFIGSALALKLHEYGYKVHILDNGSRESVKKISFPKDIVFTHADIRDYKAVEKACKNIDTIIHLAYINGTKYFYEKPDLVLDVGVKGMINVLDAAKKQGVSELLLASSSEVYQTPSIIPTPEDIPFIIPSLYNPRYSYGGGKIISELLAFHLGQTFLKKVIIFRPHNVYGPAMGNEHVIPELMNKIIFQKNKAKKIISLPIQGSGKETRSFIYIDDFTEAINYLLKKGKNKEVYNIGTTEETTILNLVSILSRVCNLKINIIKKPLQKGSTLRRCPDIKKLHALGFVPKVTLKEGLHKTFLWYNANL